MTQSDGAGTTRAPEIDWLAAEKSPEFRELTSARRKFVVPATIFFLTWYFGFILLAGYAEDFMGREFLTDGLTVGWVLALSQFVMVWAFVWAYLRRADRVFDPLAKKAADRALQSAGGSNTPVTPDRSERTPAAEQPAGEVMR